MKSLDSYDDATVCSCVCVCVLAHVGVCKDWEREGDLYKVTPLYSLCVCACVCVECGLVSDILGFTAGLLPQIFLNSTKKGRHKAERCRVCVCVCTCFLDLTYSGIELQRSTGSWIRTVVISMHLVNTQNLHGGFCSKELTNTAITHTLNALHTLLFKWCWGVYLCAVLWGFTH